MHNFPCLESSSCQGWYNYNISRRCFPLFKTQLPNFKKNFKKSSGSINKFFNIGTKSIYGMGTPRKLHLCRFSRDKIDKAGTIERFRTGCAVNIRRADIFFCIRDKSFAFRLSRFRFRCGVCRRAEREQKNADVQTPS